MPYVIEVMALGDDIYHHLESATTGLNSIQHEFQFRPTALNLRQWGLSFQRSQYDTNEVFAFLKSYRIKAAGHRPYIIAFLNAPLSSESFDNLFGSHEADNGLAVCTLHDCTQFV